MIQMQGIKTMVFHANTSLQVLCFRLSFWFKKIELVVAEEYKID